LDLVDRIDALLPQTQCRRCGYAACRPYASAIADEGAPINRCPPGGAAGVRALARLLDRPELPLDPACGEELPPRVAIIDPQACIGCARCLPACPVDAILGAQHFLHVVLEEDCNGCELCIATCPVDCIAMGARGPDRPAPAPTDNRQHFEQHRARLQREAGERERLLTERKRAARPTP
jgi:Na+-translocating ferredoxin:NAD+ oxidoreductase subunit B